MNLFPDEHIVSESDNKEIVLTTHRIWQGSGGFTSGQTTSIMLEHITSCQSKYKLNVVWLILGILIISAGGASESIELIVLGIIPFLLYFIIKQSVISISSPTAKIIINTTGMKKVKIEDFIDKIEHTKHKRLLHLNKIA